MYMTNETANINNNKESSVPKTPERWYVCTSSRLPGTVFHIFFNIFFMYIYYIFWKLR
jgi:hypothetical protein